MVDLPNDVHPISMQWPPKSVGVPLAGKKSNELLLVTATDGRFFLLGRGGRVEKTIQAHNGWHIFKAALAELAIVIHIKI